MTSNSQWDARWRQGHIQSRYPDTRQHPPTPDESATSVKTSTTTPPYPTPWKESYVADDQRYDTQRTSAYAGSYSDVSYHHPRPEQRHTPPSSRMIATSPPRHQTMGSWQSIPPSPHARQKYISSAPLTLDIPETQGKLITGPPHSLPGPILLATHCRSCHKDVLTVTLT